MSTELRFNFGRTVELGSHQFMADEIIAFATKYDPLPFHVDDAAAAKSILGGLCASGWHTCVWWMRLNLAYRQVQEARQESMPGSFPKYGPSPGFRDLRFIRPVYAGDTISYRKTNVCLAPHSHRPGWHVLQMLAEASNESGVKVMEFKPSVLLQLDR